MFKKFFKSGAVFGVNLVAFIASVSLVIFAVSCGGDSGNNSGGGQSSGSGSYTEPEKPDPSYNVTKSVTIGLQGPKLDNLTIDAVIQMNPVDPEKIEAGFDYVNVLLNGVVIDSLSKQKPGTLHDAIVSGAKSILLSDATCGQKIEVCIVGYYNNKSNNESECDEKIRTESSCRSSSSVASSSSAVSRPVLNLEPVSFGGSPTCVVKSNSGLKLDGTCSTSISTSDFYCLQGADCNDLEVSNAFEVIDVFLNAAADICSEIYSGTGGIANPSTSTQFIPCDYACADCPTYKDFESELPFGSDKYYVVRKKGTAAWGAGWYLVRADAVYAQQATVRVWRVK